MKIIGITGPSGSGKSMLGKFLSERGITVIDADELYHSLLVPPSECLDLIREAFGKEVFNADGTLDRSMLAHIVFSDKCKLELLNTTVLSVVIKELKKHISSLKARGENTVAVDAPTLIESGFHKECDCVISVLSDANTRTERISERDGISNSAAAERIKAQKPDEFYKKHSNIVIINDGDLEAFEKDAERIYISLIKQP